MKSIILLSIMSIFLFADKVLVINSNSKIDKYNEAISEFQKSFTKPFKIIDISKMNKNEIKEYLYDEYPDVIYTVGAKAYQYANKFIPEKKIYFSSIVNWKRLPMNGKRFGVSNELHSGMQLTLIKSIFNDIKTIGLIYSKYTKDIKNDFEINANHLGIKIVSKEVTKNFIENIHFDDLINKTEAMIIIADPILLSEETNIKNLFMLSKDMKKPIFTYHELFINYGASLVLSVDDPTIGRQIATMMQSDIDNSDMDKIQYPAGSEVIFNKKEIVKMGIKFNSNVSFISNKVIE